ncbi:MAG: cation:proton antiporter [Pseudoflavonifractor sp.]|nr:cation:proton antiporter [Alloprevotella sp.]MCM1116275.1 cation:proton antiporter [Pseudoflavonifractor sp.]
MIIASAAAGALDIEGLIFDLAFILILGGITTLLFKWLKQPVVLGYIVAGFLASPNFTYLPSVSTMENIDFWAEIGIVVLLFALGLEFSFRKLLNAGGSAIVTALLNIAGMIVVGYLIGHGLGFSPINSIFLGCMISMASTTIIIKALNDLGLQHRRFAPLVFAVLIVEDLFAVVMMVILSSIAINNTVEGGEMLKSISKLGFFLIMWFAVGVFILPSALNAARRYLSDETLLVVSMGLCFGMAVFSAYCGFSMALGAFVIGSIIAGTSFAERIEHVVSPVKDLFGAVFFISVGMMVNPAVLVDYWAPILLISAAVIIGSAIFGCLGMLLTGQSLKVSIEVGLSLTQIGEFSFIIATLGMSLGVLDADLYPIIVAVSVLTTFTTPYFIRLSGPLSALVERHLPKRFHFLLDRYTSQAASESETAILWKTVLKRYLWRIMLYSVMLASIVMITLRWVYPWIDGIIPSWSRLLTTAVALAAMSPFLLALSLPASKRTERKRLVAANARFDVPLIVMSLFRMIIALAFIVYLMVSLYSVAAGVALGIAIFILIVVMFSKRVGRQLRQMEAKFINNLNERELRRSGRNNNLVSNIHLAFMQVSYACPFVGERLADSQLRSKYGANIATIQRGSTVIPVPGGDTRLFPGDIISVAGTDEELQRLLPLVEAPLPDAPADAPRPDDYKLTSIQLSDTSPLIGTTVASSGLRDKYKALLVSIARGDDFIQPEANTRLEPHDILWLVGSPSALAAIK